jgi:hypothetical protein
LNCGAFAISAVACAAKKERHDIIEKVIAQKRGKEEGKRKDLVWGR